MSEQEIPELEELELHFWRPNDNNHEVPAYLLTQVLAGMQRVIYLLAMEQESVEVRLRERVSHAIEQKYVLMCSPPSEGSVNLSATLGDPTSDIFAPLEIAQVAEMFRSVRQSLVAGLASELARLIPDRIRRIRLIEAFRSMLPKPGSGWNVDIIDQKSQVVTLNERLYPFFRPTQLEAAEGSIQTVTGKLNSIKFGERRFTIIYPVANRELECFYDEAVEELLLDNPREFIQVTGYVIFDEHDLPVKIQAVQDIRELDLSPFVVSQIETARITLRFQSPLILYPTLDSDYQRISLQQPTLGIDVSASTREELGEELHAEILMLWREYATERDDVLSPAALELKYRLLNVLHEVTNAEG